MVKMYQKQGEITMNKKDLIKVIGGRKKSSKVLSNILKCLWNGVGRA